MIFALPASAAWFKPNDKEIAQLVKDCAKIPELPKRLEFISGFFLGMPYRLGPLGEGEDGDFDRDPLIRYDYVDCTTFIETVMSLAYSQRVKEVEEWSQRIRYRKSLLSYADRNHFISVDWIPNNTIAGFIRDITQEIGGDKTQWAEKNISKRLWYASKTADELSGFDKLKPSARSALVQKWRTLGASLNDEKARLAYVPINGMPAISSSIPSGAIFNLVREDLPDKPVLVSHQGFLFQKTGGTYVRHAGPNKGVEDVLLSEYLKKYEGSSWPVLGLNLLMPLDPAAKKVK